MANLNLRQLAVEQTTLSVLMQDREKMDTETIISVHKDGITINAIDITEITKPNGTIETVYVYTFEENEKVFAFAGAVLVKIFKSWIEATEGDVTEVNNILAEHGVKVVLSSSLTKAGKDVTTVKVI